MPRSARRILTIIVFLVVLLGILAAGALATGRVSYVTTSGVSMVPLYHQGDLVVVAKANSYKVGEIVAYEVPAQHLVVLHRIIGRQGAGFVMKGDHNESIDPTHPTANEVLGRAVLLVPDGGIWLDRLTSPLALALITFLLLSGGGAAVQNTQRRRKGRTMALHQRSHRKGESAKPLATAAPWLRTALVAATVVGLGGAALAAWAWSTPLAVRTTRAPVPLSMVFSYSASVPQTPAYDGTTVASPQPVFRKLTNTVNVHLAYRGVPGTVAVAAQLSTPGGWHSTIPLAPPTTIGTTRYDANVPLNLNSLDTRARAAASITGLPAEPLSVTVVAQVSGTDGARFAPTLLLGLSPLQLTLVGSANALVVDRSAAVGRTLTVPRTIGVLGWHITVARARTVSAILLLAGLLSAAALALAALLSAPTSEGAGIRRRYAAQLVDVEPMATPPGHPVVDVTDFVALTRLAEQYGSLVLHWSRNDVDTFVVQTQEANYRYRAGLSTTAEDAQRPVAPEILFDTLTEDPPRPAVTVR